MSQSNQRAKEIIEQVVYITIATTSADGQAWNTPVFSAYDDSYNFYWGSHVDSQHSKNIAKNSKVFLVIYDSTIPAGEGEGVYVKAIASELTDPDEITKAHQLLQSRRPVPYWTLDQMQPDSPVRVFKAVPVKTWMNGEGEVDGTYVDNRVEISL
jgi:nitroimidazol reductase NimA-like FMN-containing flavoprotein (pyridoxamine 5'-phosphate oxidase superfamily)